MARQVSAARCFSLRSRRFTVIPGNAECLFREFLVGELWRILERMPRFKEFLGGLLTANDDILDGPAVLIE